MRRRAKHATDRVQGGRDMHIEVRVDAAGDELLCCCDRGHVRPCWSHFRTGTVRCRSDSPGMGLLTAGSYQVTHDRLVPKATPARSTDRLQGSQGAGRSPGQTGREYVAIQHPWRSRRAARGYAASVAQARRGGVLRRWMLGGYLLNDSSPRPGQAEGQVAVGMLCKRLPTALLVWLTNAVLTH